MNQIAVSQPLAGWSVVCLRPSMQQAAVRRAVKARGAHHVTLPGLRLEALEASGELYRVLGCAAVVFTSPAAVHYAAQQLPLKQLLTGRAFSVGAGTTAALRRHHIDAIAPPDDAMHSDGVLALPQWSRHSGEVGLVTAPGGRGIIANGLAERGFAVHRANVYRRLPPRFDARHHAALLNAPAPRAVLVSSGEALDGTLENLPRNCRHRLLDSVAVASSERLADICRKRGFPEAIRATAPTAAAMLDTLARHVAFVHFQ